MNETVEGEALLKDFINLHDTHGCLEKAQTHVIFDAFAEFYHKKTKKKKGGKILLFQLLSMKETYLVGREYQLYNGIKNDKYKTLNEKCQNAFRLWKEQTNSVNGDVIDDTKDLESRLRNISPDISNALFLEAYEYIYVDNQEMFKEFAGAKYLLLELDCNVDLNEVESLSDTNSNLVLYVPGKVSTDVTKKIESHNAIVCCICDSSVESHKIINFNNEKWAENWVKSCRKNSMTNYFYSDEEPEVFRHALTKNDSKSLYHVAAVLYESKKYNESYRFLVRGMENQDVDVLKLLYLLKLFYDQGVGEMSQCPIQSRSLEEKIRQIKNQSSQSTFYS